MTTHVGIFQRLLPFAIGTAVCFSACGNGGLPQVTPDVSISEPSNNSSVNLPADKKIAVNFTTNYLLRPPGTCGGEQYCGHLYVMLDNTNCNTGNNPYNTLAVSSPTSADFSSCASPTGQHTITLELHNDDGSPVRNLVGSVVTSKVTVTAQ